MVSLTNWLFRLQAPRQPVDKLEPVLAAQRLEARRIALRQEPREAKEQNRSEQQTKAAPHQEAPVPRGIRR